MRPAPPKAASAPQTWRERLQALRNVPPLLKMVWETSPSLAFSTLFLRCLSAFFPLATLWVSKLIIDLVVRAIRHQPYERSLIWKLLILELLLAMGSDTLGRAVSLVDSLLGDRFTNHVSIKLMEHATSLDLMSFEDPVFYDKMERARRQTTARLGMLASISGMAQQILTLISLLSAVLFYYPWLLLLLAAATVPVFLGETRFAMLNYSMLYRYTPERRELDYLRYLGASNESAKEIKIFGMGQYLIGRSRALFERFYAENKHLAIRRAWHGTLLSVIPSAAYYTAYVLIIRKALAGFLSVGDLTLIAGAFSRARTIMENLVSSLAGISEQALFIQDLFDFFETKPSIQSPPNALPVPRPIRYGFEFVNVSFSYPGSDKQVLNNVSFCFDADEKIALVGENGAGKTTLVKLLARLYDPTAGRILLDGVDVRDYEVNDLRREIGVIFQDYMRYDALAAENIGFGRIEHLNDEARVFRSAEKSLAAPVIDGLPARYRQMLGRRFEGGVDLSTGQWQKIALARAYMRDAQILILDEPTASLDARAEFEVYQRFVELTTGKMAVLISHRFSTVRMADRILVLEHGRIVEQGSHRQLVALGGKYSELFELQAAGYR
ncbi:MAG: ABC transporter ATP-binding protein/permease [Acidobacteriota bacterium]|nr:ABC transporter ATP-binding protein/permease [Acidobacteriota bacterium]